MAKHAFSRKVSDDEIIAYLRRFQHDHGYPASVRDIAMALGIVASSQVYLRLNKLVELGRIKKDDKLARSIVVIK
jgi:hypothetical protein